MTETTEYIPAEVGGMDLIERLATNPNVDPDKLQKILDMKEQEITREAKRAYNADFVLAQADIKMVVKNNRNEQTKSNYADLTAVIEMAKPIWTEHGFALSFYEEDCPKPDMIRIMCDIMHKAGHTVTRHLDVPIDDKGSQGKTNKTPMHGKGSSIAYDRRYLTCMIWHIPTGDDNDGNGPKSDGPEYITTDQMNIITETLKECGVSEARFVKLLNSRNIASIEDIPGKWFEWAIKTIRNATPDNAK